MTDNTDTDALIERLRLIQAWHTPGGPTPKQEEPSIHKTIKLTIDKLDTLRTQVADLTAKLAEAEARLLEILRTPQLIIYDEASEWPKETDNDG